MTRVAVIGAGMTRFVRRAEETPGELASQAVSMALADAGLGIEDIDAVCLGTAPDAFDGIHMNGENLIAGAGGTPQALPAPLRRRGHRGDEPHPRLDARGRRASSTPAWWCARRRCLPASPTRRAPS